MKIRIYSTLLTIALFSLPACSSSQTEVPESVQKAFEQKYPGEDDPDWQIDANGNFESNFKIDGKSLRADFHPDGYWIETESSMEEKELPKAVRERLERDFKEEEITEVGEVNHYQKGRFYDIEFKQKGKNKDVEFREDGSIIN